eukprot:CAMPEP_0177351830 /NCGR_PEP_ID=MMETSP0368-20130122/32036_1 /TAXON_ID=447022 ORGANISM="Scrippsiella hangoei-like, Strain SHHI-4" /NCGR_SAMPLE_ID=MMETSP0368 /ASSEMBLY_ACC=CAM_ASM_000363 /LENGTH=176 /DNA_ID=CAMNT_0018813791 /DNA_START=337 /DNA_END=864 /DNA_ORIENTATION=-
MGAQLPLSAPSGSKRTHTEMRPSAVSQWSCVGELHVGSSMALPQLQPPPGMGRIAKWISRRGGCERTARSRNSKASSEETMTALPRESAHVPRKSEGVKGPPVAAEEAPPEPCDTGTGRGSVTGTAHRSETRRSAACVCAPLILLSHSLSLEPSSHMAAAGNQPSRLAAAHPARPA